MKAFPQNEAIMYIDLPLETQQGMDLRDYFASKAMQGMATWDLKTMHKLAEDFGEDPVKYLARNSYAIADAMMEARK